MSKQSKRTRNSILFFASALVCLAIDQVTKALLDVAPEGTTLWEGISGVFDFTLVHNTGGAWNIFDNAAFALGVFGIIICIVCLVIAHLRRNEGSVPEMLALSLILAGGAGNAIDRFLRGYVVDFLDFSLIDFPVFNVADICVCCGFALVFVLLFLGLREQEPTGNEGAEQGEACGQNAVSDQDDSAH